MELSPCQFAIYDVNEDGFVTLKEFKLVYNDYISNKLFKDLDQDGKYSDVYSALSVTAHIIALFHVSLINVVSFRASVFIR